MSHSTFKFIANFILALVLIILLRQWSWLLGLLTICLMLEAKAFFYLNSVLPISLSIPFAYIQSTCICRSGSESRQEDAPFSKWDFIKPIAYRWATKNERACSCSSCCWKSSPQTFGCFISDDFIVPGTLALLFVSSTSTCVCPLLRQTCSYSYVCQLACLDSVTCISKSVSILSSS